MTRARDNADLGDSFGVLGSGVTGGSGLTALGTVATGDLSNIDASFQTYCQIPFTSTTLGLSATAIGLTDQVSSVGMPKTSGFTVVSSEYVVVSIAGIYLIDMQVSGMGSSAISRENWAGVFMTTDGSTVPTTSSTNILKMVWVNPYVLSAYNYISQSSKVIYEFTGTTTWLKCFGRGTNSAQTMDDVSTSVKRSALTIIKIK